MYLEEVVKHTLVLIMMCILAGGCQRGGVAVPASSFYRSAPLPGQETHSNTPPPTSDLQLTQTNAPLASSNAPVSPINAPIQPTRAYGPTPAAALAFTPPVVLYVPPIDLTRNGRSHAAYLGYELQTLDNVWVRQDDQLRDNRSGNNSRFERRAISTRVHTRVQ
jgi:hypothetical protein